MINSDSVSNSSATILNPTAPYAGFWQRFVACFIDGIVIIAFGLVGAMIIPVIGPFILAALYYPIFVASPMKATPGKALFGLQVQTESGETLSLGQAFGRWLLSYISGAFLLVGYLIQPFTAKRQTFHDLVIQSVVVVREQTPGTNYLDVWIEQLRSIFSGETKSSTARTNADVSVNSNPSSSAGASSGSPTSSASNLESATSNQTDDSIQKLEKLHHLLKEGILTEDEFNQKKAELLKKL